MHRASVLEQAWHSLKDLQEGYSVLEVHAYMQTPSSITQINPPEESIRRNASLMTWSNH